MNPSLFIVIVVSLQNLGFNLVHPVTPAFISAMGMQDWIFGISYAAMALTSFLFSKEAGQLCLRFESKMVFAVGCIGYAGMQLLFLTSKNEGQVIFWRLCSGFFVAMINVAALAYLIHVSIDEQRARNLTYLATAIAVTTALGYTAGGIIGNASYSHAFIIQALVLTGAGLSLALFGNSCTKERIGIAELLHNGNPLRLGSPGFHVQRHIIKYLVITLISMSALTIYEQSLNYYLKDTLSYTPMDIGYLKGAIGVVTLAANQVIAFRLMRKDRLLHHVGMVFALASCTNLLFTVLNTGRGFIVGNLLFTVFNAMHLPMVQELVTSADMHHQHELVTLYNEMRSIGWIIGGLAAGIAYEICSLLPFASTTVLFACLAGICLHEEHLEQSGK